MKKIIPQIVILAGGTGTRLWPLSRKNFPKQFQPLVGRQTLFQLALARAQKITSLKNVFVATNQQFVPLVKKQAPGLSCENIISEPAFRDTATCLGYAAMLLESRNPGGVMAVIYADHLILDEGELVRKVNAAAELVNRGKLAIIEVESQYPATQLGWVETGRELPKVYGERVLEFKRFQEKPNLIKAKQFHNKKNFLWNTGLYIWRTDVLLEKFKKYLPKSWKHFQKIKKVLADGATKQTRLQEIIKEEYSACEKISIDFGVMEKLNREEVVILPAKLGWSDVGTWGSLKDELSKSKENLIENENIVINSKGNFVKTVDKKLVALIGVDDLIVVDSGDALLVCRKDCSSDVKKIVQQLEEKGKLL